MSTYPKRLIEVDLPIKKISAHARREKSIRHGHISTLHIWWARRPLAACRAVICAALWIDPVDELCPQEFRDQAAEIVTKFAQKAATDSELADHCSAESWGKWKTLAKAENKLDTSNSQHLTTLRYLLLDFIADFANWDNSTQPDYLETARALTQAAHEALGGEPGTRPLVVDPFAGGGSIPLEALRVGADAFASDLNPVAVLLNKVVLEYIPKYGQRLADEVRKWGQWVKEQAEQELAEFYPKDPDGSTPIAYLWARTIISEAPDDGTHIPVEVPLMRSLWLAKKAGRNKALRWIRDENGKVKTETVEVTYADGVTRKVRRPLLDIFEPKNESEVEKGTVARGSATCPVTGFTTPVASVRRQLQERRGGAMDVRMFCVVVTKPNTQGRFYRLPSNIDIEVVRKTTIGLENKLQILNTSNPNGLSVVPNEPVPPQGRSFRFESYGIREWGDLFTQRQLLALVTLVKLVKDAEQKLLNEDTAKNNQLLTATQACLALAIDRCTNQISSLSKWHNGREVVDGVFTRQAVPMLWDFGEINLLSGSDGYWKGAISWIISVIGSIQSDNSGQAEKTSATNLYYLPNDAVKGFFTDPPYYDSIEYSDLSDFFYVWLKRTLPGSLRISFQDELTPKEEECIVNPNRGQDKAYFEKKMQQAMIEGQRVLAPDGIGIVVFAHKSTSGWEAQLQAMISAGWIVTGSWAIDTEMGTRLIAMNSAALASSVHLVCRPRENPDGSLREEIGDWRDVLQELPKRIQEWMPRLSEQGVVGADAIFACLGPALEIFSRYSSVEKASGEQVSLKEYLEYVWAAVAKEALSMIFSGADATGFEADARLTAMWLWTLSTGETSFSGSDGEESQEEDTEEDEEAGKKAKVSGFTLEFDTARKIAQGLGAHLEKLTHLVEVQGNKARLLPVIERATYLFGKEAANPQVKKKPKNSKQLTITGVLEEISEDDQGEIKPTKKGETVCDRLHQSMILFASGRSEALKRFLSKDGEGVGTDPNFWQLAQAFSALYPPGTDEKRWVDGVLTRKKGLGQ